MYVLHIILIICLSIVLKLYRHICTYIHLYDNKICAIRRAHLRSSQHCAVIVEQIARLGVVLMSTWINECKGSEGYWNVDDRMECNKSAETSWCRKTDGSTRSCSFFVVGPMTRHRSQPRVLGPRFGHEFPSSLVPLQPPPLGSAVCDTALRNSWQKNVRVSPFITPAFSSSSYPRSSSTTIIRS